MKASGLLLKKDDKYAGLVLYTGGLGMDTTGRPVIGNLRLKPLIMILNLIMYIQAYMSPTRMTIVTISHKTFINFRVQKRVISYY